MKISKLFHWLYASLMLAPVFAVGVTCLTHVFNKETGIIEVPKYETIDNTYIFDENEENNFEDLNLYGKYVRATNIVQANNVYTYNFKFLSTSNEKYDFYLEDPERINYLRITDSDGEQLFSFYNFPYEQSIDLLSYTSEDIKYIDLQIPSELECSNFEFALGYMTLSPVPYEDIPKMSVSSNEENIFYYSIDRLKESPYFNWAYNSFLFGPFGSITNIFSLPQNNIVSMLLSYWLALSVIWLVFDLIMYIPLLVHKWIDKAMIE